MPRRLTAAAVLLTALPLVLVACAASKDPKPGAPAHHTADGFRNLYIDDPNKTLFHFLATKHFGDTTWANHAARAAEVPVRPLDITGVKTRPAGLRISWLGHSTFLIQWRDVNILTDPIFGDRASPLNFAGPKRYVRHVVDYRQLPEIDYVIISHNHYDHLNRAAVDILGNGPLYLVPLKLKTWFTEAGIDPARVQEMDWWDRADFVGARFQAQPSQHWTARGLFDRRKTLWVSWRIDLADGQDSISLWFAGDTGYNDKQFKEIGAKAGPVDVALIPIGGYLPRDFMSPYHVNPEEAVRVHRDVGARHSIGMHWGTFPLTAEGPGDPPRELAAARTRLGVAAEDFTIMAVGETREMNLPE